MVSIATGQGRIAFSRDAAGELVVMPLHPGMELDVREHAFLLSSHTIDFSYTRVQGLRNILLGGQGMFMGPIRCALGARTSHLARLRQRVRKDAQGA